MGQETQHVGARVPPQQKQRWEQAQQQSEFDTMTEWLKWVVESHLAGYNSPDDGADSESMSKVLDELDSLSSEVDRLHNRMEQVGQVERQASYDMDRVLLELLPGRGSQGITPDELATHIGADSETVSHRLGELYESTKGVTATTDSDGTPRYRNESDY